MGSIWPWSRITELEQKLGDAEHEAYRANATADLRLLIVERMERDNDVLLEKLKEARTTHAKLRVQLADAHLRDPKTGRIMPKGKLL